MKKTGDFTRNLELVAILHNIRSLHNVGSIFRTADGAGVKKLYLCGITPAPLDRLGRTPAALAKVALGSEKTVAWEKCASAAGAIKKLRREGYKILALEQSSRSIAYNRFRAVGKLALVLGAEVNGLSSGILKEADKILEIPMRGKKESLNVAVAFGIAAYGLAAK